MANKNYCRGRRKEYGACEKLKKEGFEIVQRTAGSHSPIDILAIDTKNKIIKLVQVKAGPLSPGKQKEILKENRTLSGEFEVSFEIVN